MAAESLEVRLARLEGGYSQISERLGVIQQRLARLEAKVDEVRLELIGRIDEVDGRIDQLRSEVIGRMDQVRFESAGRMDRLEGRIVQQF